MSVRDDKNPYRFQREKPRLGERVFVADRAHVSGAVGLADDVSVWPMAVIRGDVNRISIGARSNVQDGSVLHVTHEGPETPAGGPLTVGEDVTIGHRVILHACTIGDRVLVGMGSILMDDVEVGDDVIVGAGALVTPGTKLEPRTLWKGSPARLARPLSSEEVTMLKYSAGHYVRLKDLYLADRAEAGRSGTGGTD